MAFNQLHSENEVLIKLNDLYNVWEDSEEAWDHFMQGYFLACARAIWKLLPQHASREGIEVAERYMLGLASDEELSKAEYEAEGAAFNIDYDVSPGDIKKWINDIKHIPQEELCKMIHPNEAIESYEPKEILKYAAYFAHFAMKYPYYNSISTITTSEKIPEEYLVFLSPSVLQEMLL